MVFAKDKYDYAYFERNDCVQRNLSVKLSLILKAFDIVWFVSSACNLRRHCVSGVNVQ